jgi:hypothetical protein
MVIVKIFTFLQENKFYINILDNLFKISEIIKRLKYRNI